jgi:hypothetical protein
MTLNKCSHPGSPRATKRLGTQSFCNASNAWAPFPTKLNDLMKLIRRRVSALGQKQTFRPRNCDVRFAPNSGDWVCWDGAAYIRPTPPLHATPSRTELETLLGPQDRGVSQNYRTVALQSSSSDRARRCSTTSLISLSTKIARAAMRCLCSGLRVL